MFCLLLVIVGSFGLASDNPFGDYIDKRAVCGNNALYLVLRLQGWSVDYRELNAVLGGPSLDGKSMADLKNAAIKLGIPATVRRANIEKIEFARMPFLLHGAYGRRFSGEEQGSGWHFMVVSRTENGKLVMYDGTSGNEVASTIDWLKEAGGEYYFLDIPPNERGWDKFLAYQWLITAVLGIAITLIIGDVCRFPWRFALKIFALFILTVLLGLVGRNSYGSDPVGGEDVVWRGQGHDCNNALSLYVQSLNPVNPEQIRKIAVDRKNLSLTEMADSATSCGVYSRVRTIGIDDLKTSTLPLIALMRDPRGSGNYYVVVTGVFPSSVEYFEGAYLSWLEVDNDQFLRDWTGHVIVSSNRDGTSLSSIASWSFSFITIVSAWTIFAIYRKRVGLC